MSADDSAPHARFEQGCRLFDDGRFFEAHEAWEDAWRAEKGPGRRHLQGLIQIAAGFHKGITEGKSEGCVVLLEAGLSKLAGDWRPEFQEDVRRCLERARRWQRGESAELGAVVVPRLGLPHAPGSVQSE